MVNVTISVSELLKSKMVEHSDENWSKVCREAIDAHIHLLENPFPDIKIELSEVRFSYHKGKPGIILNLNLTNKMNTPLTLDRILFDVNFSPMPAETLDLGSGIEMRKSVIPMGKWVTRPFIELDPDLILRVNERLDRPFQCGVHIIAFFEDYKEAYYESRAVRVPIYDWQQFVDIVIEDEKKKIEIRQNKLLGIRS